MFSGPLPLLPRFLPLSISQFSIPLCLLHLQVGSPHELTLSEILRTLEYPINGKKVHQGTWGAQPPKCLPSAQVMVPGSWDQVLCGATCSAENLLLPLLLPLPPLLLSFR